METACAPSVLLALLASPALANGPGESLEDEIAAREPAFEAIGVAAPAFEVEDAAGTPVSLSDLGDRILVVAFQPPGCGQPCADQLAILADLQGKVQVGGMADLVDVVTITQGGPPAAPALDPADWVDLRTEAPEDLAAAYAATLAREPEAEPVIYVLDRGGRLAGAFHGTGFKPLNLLLYVNGLTIAPSEGGAAQEGWWARLMGVLG